MPEDLRSIYKNIVLNPNLGAPQRWATLAAKLNEENRPTLNLARGLPGRFSLAPAGYEAVQKYASDRARIGEAQGYRNNPENAENQLRLKKPLQKLFGFEINHQDIIPIERGVKGIYQISHALGEGIVFMSLPGYPNWIQALNEVKQKEGKNSFYHHLEKRQNSGSIYGINTLGVTNFDFDPWLLEWNINKAKEAGEKPSALLLLYMHNPRGTKLEKELSKIAEIAKDNPDMAIIVDAAYLNDRNLKFEKQEHQSDLSPDNTLNFQSPIAELIKHYPAITEQLVMLCPTAKLGSFDEGGGVIVCPNQKVKEKIINKRFAEAPDFGLPQTSIEMTIGTFTRAASGGVAQLSEHFRPILDAGVKHAEKLGMHPGHSIDGSYYLMSWVDGIGSKSQHLRCVNGRTRIQTDNDLCWHLALSGVTAMPVVHRPDRMGTGLVRLTANNEANLIKGLDIINSLGMSKETSRTPWEDGWKPNLTPSFGREV